VNSIFCENEWWITKQWKWWVYKSMHVKSVKY